MTDRKKRINEELRPLAGGRHYDEQRDGREKEVERFVCYEKRWNG